MMEQKGLKPQKCPWIGWSLRSPLRVSDSKFQCGILCPIPGSDNRVRGEEGHRAMALDGSPMSKPNICLTMQSQWAPSHTLSQAPRQGPPCPTGTCHDSSQLDEYARALQETLTALTLPTTFYTCSSLRFAFLKWWAGWHVLGTAFDECVPWTLLTQQKLT